MITFSEIFTPPLSQITMDSIDDSSLDEDLATSVFPADVIGQSPTLASQGVVIPSGLDATLASFHQVLAGRVAPFCVPHSRGVTCTRVMSALALSMLPLHW